MIKLYFHHTPNPMKVTLLLEELALPYEPVPIDIFKGEQHQDWYLKINPNGKVPAIIDGDMAVFDSSAILIYLAEKHGRFLTTDPAGRTSVLSWLMFVASGLSPFSGQATHFLLHAPEPIPYARERYVKEVARHYRVMETRLAATPFLGGEDYSIADIAMWGWVRLAHLALDDKQALDAFPNVKRVHEWISARPAAIRAEAVGKRFDMKRVVDDETRTAMFSSARN